MKKEQARKTRFIKSYTGFSYLMGRDEIYFLMHMVDIEFLRELGYRVSWSKDEYMNRMQMGLYTFNKCVGNLERMGLLERIYAKLGRKVYYNLNTEVYKRLIHICGATDNFQLLKSFFETAIKKEGRTIGSITDEEIIRELGESPLSNKKKETPYVKCYIGFSYLLNRDEIYFLMHLNEIEYLRNVNSNLFQTRREWLEKMSIPQCTFNSCVKNLSELGIIENLKGKQGKGYYRLNIPVYNKLVKICGATCNYYALKNFFQDTIVKKGRSLSSVTEVEIERLDAYGRELMIKSRSS